MTEDIINAPNHYTWHPSGRQPTEFSNHMLTNLGVAFNYLWRYQHKGTPVQDLQKALKHLDFEMNQQRGVTELPHKFDIDYFKETITPSFDSHNIGNALLYIIQCHNSGYGGHIGAGSLYQAVNNIKKELDKIS